MKMSRPILPILTQKLVDMATSVEQSKKRVKSVIHDQIPTVPYGENWVKIGSVDPETICLNG